MRRFLAPLLALLLVASCGDDGLRTGDLLFFGIPTDYGASSQSSGSTSEAAAGSEGTMSSAIAAATGRGETNYIHVAIVEVDEDGLPWIIDATIARGVDRHPLDTTLRDFTLRDGSLPTLTVMRLRRSRSDLVRFVQNAKQFVGLPYDLYFAPDSSAFYCSELVRDSYTTESGEFLFDDAPMNFLASDGTMPPYWERLFASLGTCVPQGVRGTNPQAMLSSPLLREVDVLGKYLE